MATPPTLVSEYESSWSTTTSSKSSTAFDAEAGDVLVVVAGGSTSNGQLSDPTNSGTALTWTLRQYYYNVSSRSPVYLWTAVVDTARDDMTVTVARPTGSSYYGFNLLQWRGSDGVGASAKTNGTGAPSLSLTTTQPDSAVVVIVGDYNSTTGFRTWRTGPGAATEILYVSPSATFFAAYHADADAAAAKTVGLTAPTGQAYTILAVEILAQTAVTATWDTAWDVLAAVTATWGTAWDVQVLTVVADWDTAWDIAQGVTATWDTSWNVISRGTWRQYVLSDEWAAAVTARQRTISARVDVIDRNDTVLADLPVVSGSVTFDGESAEQWGCTLTLTDPASVPTTTAAPLDLRSGLRVRLWWRLLVDGAWADIPVGTFHLEDPRTVDDGTLQISVTGRDPIALARRNTYGTQVIQLGGLTVSDALARLFAAIAPNLPTRVEASTVTLPASYEVGTNADPAQDWTDIAAIAGFVVRTDRLGVIVAGPRPDPAHTMLRLVEGDGCAMTSVSRELRTSGMVNRVVAVSTSTEVVPPVSAVVQDDDEGSPTWVGRFGPFTTRIESDAIASAEAAQNMARATFERWRRPTETVEVTMPPRPDLGYRDLAEVVRLRAGVGGLFRVSKWTLPLDREPKPMTVTFMSQAVSS